MSDSAWTADDLRGFLKQPSQLAADGDKPATDKVLHQRLQWESRPDDVLPSPTEPPDRDGFVFVGLVYPVLRLTRSLFELYAEALDRRPAVAAYSRPDPVVQAGKILTNDPNNSVIHFMPDDESRQAFLQFLLSYVFRRNGRCYVLRPFNHLVRWPAPSERLVGCTTLLPFSADAGWEQPLAGANVFRLVDRQSASAETASAIDRVAREERALCSL